MIDGLIDRQPIDVRLVPQADIPSAAALSRNAVID
jgi:hypothetical protein